MSYNFQKLKFLRQSLGNVLKLIVSGPVSYNFRRFQPKSQEMSYNLKKLKFSCYLKKKKREFLNAATQPYSRRLGGGAPQISHREPNV